MIKKGGHYRFFSPRLSQSPKKTVLLAFSSPKFWKARAKNLLWNLDARKNTRFSEMFLASKILTLFLKFLRVKILAHLSNFLPSYFWYLRSYAKWAKFHIFWQYSLKNIRMVLLALVLFTRNFFYPHNSKVWRILDFSSLFFDFYCFTLSHTIFSFALFSSDARKKRICEGKKNLLGGRGALMALQVTYVNINRTRGLSTP